MCNVCVPFVFISILHYHRQFLIILFARDYTTLILPCASWKSVSVHSVCLSICFSFFTSRVRRRLLHFVSLSLFLFPTIFDTRGVETTAKQKMKMKQVFILPTAILKMFRDFSASPCPEQKKKIRRLWPSALLYLIRLCVSASVVGPR